MNLDQKMRRIRQIIGVPVIFAIRATEDNPEIIAMDVSKKEEKIGSDPEQVYIG